MFIFLMGCRPGVIEPGPPGQYSEWYWGQMSGTRNGVEYMVPRVGAIYNVPTVNPSCFSNTISVQITEFDKSGTERTEIFFDRVPIKQGVYRYLAINPRDCQTDPDSVAIPSVGFGRLEGDVQLNTYLLVPAASNHLSVTFLDTATGLMGGSFDVTMVALRPPREGDPDTVRCIGRFETKLRRQNEKYKTD